MGGQVFFTGFDSTSNVSVARHSNVLLINCDFNKSQRGAHGGYQLAKDIDQISALEIIRALEGPVALTECSTDHNECEIAAACQMQSKWQIINLAIRRALSELSLADLSKPIQQNMNIDLSAALAEFNASQDLLEITQ